MKGIDRPKQCSPIHQILHFPELFDVRVQVSFVDLNVHLLKHYYVCSLNDIMHVQNFPLALLMTATSTQCWTRLTSCTYHSMVLINVYVEVITKQ
jgi:hypothetical protein